MSAGGYTHLILAGDPRMTIRVREALPKHLAAKLTDTVVASGISVSGQSVRLDVGHHNIETLKIVPGSIPSLTPDYIVLESGDYDGDGISDIAVFRQSSG